MQYRLLTLSNERKISWASISTMKQSTWWQRTNMNMTTTTQPALCTQIRKQKMRKSRCIDKQEKFKWKICLILSILCWKTKLINNLSEFMRDVLVHRRIDWGKYQYSRAISGIFCEIDLIYIICVGAHGDAWSGERREGKALNFKSTNVDSWLVYSSNYCNVFPFDNVPGDRWLDFTGGTKNMYLCIINAWLEFDFKLPHRMA